MRPLVAVALAVLLVVPAAHAATLPVEIRTQLLGPEGEATDRLERGTTGTLRVNVTNGHNRTVNVTFPSVPGPNGTVRQTGPIAPNGTGRVPIRITVPADAEAGPKTIPIRGTIEVEDNGTWSRGQNITVNATLTVVVPAPPSPRFPWLPVALVVAAAGLGGTALYLKRREPTQQLPPEPTEEEVQRGIQERRESIQDAKRRDLEAAIDRARDRLERGEITEYQFERIKEDKEAKLDELEDADDG